MMKQEIRKIEILILAAGQSTRMIGINKLLKNLNGKTLVEKVVFQSLKSKASNVSIIIQEKDLEIENVLSLLPIKILKTSFENIGIGYSISKGMELLKKNDPEGVLILLGDMPDITTKHINRMIDEFINNSLQKIIRACSENMIPGNPVLFPKSFFDLLLKLKGDKGARKILNNYNHMIKYIILPKMTALTDIDTQEQYDEWRKRNSLSKKNLNDR